MDIGKGGQRVPLTLCVFPRHFKEGSLYTRVSLRGGMWGREGDQRPGCVTGTGARGTRESRGPEPGISVRVAEAGMTRFKRWPWCERLRAGQGRQRRGGREPRPEDLKSSGKRTGTVTLAGGTVSRELEPAGSEGSACGGKMQSWGVGPVGSRRGTRGSPTPPCPGQWRQGSGKTSWGGGCPASVAGKPKGCSIKGPSGLDVLLMTHRRVEGLRPAGEGSRSGVHRA